MDLQKIKSILSSEINPTLESEKYRLAAVLIVIYGKNPIVLMTEKPEDMKFHAGEISFPGGKFETSDSDLLDTALRETREEIGLDIPREKVIGQLEPVVTLNSGFIILPFIAVIDEILSLASNEEVKKIIHIPLETFLKTLKKDPTFTDDTTNDMFVLEHKGKIIWGASARMLKQIDERLKN